MQIHNEHLSAFLDEQLPHEEHVAVESRLRDDAALAAEYHAVKAVKTLLGKRALALRGTAPADARHLVLLNIEQEWHRSKTLDRIEQESKRQEAGKIDDTAFGKHSTAAHSSQGTSPLALVQHPTKRASSLGSTMNLLSFLPKLPVLLAAALVLMIAGWFGMRLLLPHAEQNNRQDSAQAHQQETSYKAVFIKESLRNYHAVCEGKITLQYKTNSYEELDKFFHTHGIHYNIVHPKINAELLGGVVSEENGKKSAHLVFKRGDTLLYMWEIDLDETSIRHTSFQEDVWNLLRKGEWLWDTATEDSTTVVFWEDDKQGNRTLCSVVATLPRKELQPLFQ